MENEKNTMNATLFSTAQEKPKVEEKPHRRNLSHSCQISFRSRLPRKGSRGVSLKFIRVTNLGFASSSKLVLRFSSPLNFTDLRSSSVGAPIQRAVPTRRDAAD